MRAVIDEMRADEAMVGKLAYKMSYLIQCLVVAGFLKDGGDLLPVLDNAISVVVREPKAAEYYHDLLHSKHKIPSSSTVYRHRLTLHAGWCMLQAVRIDEMLSSPFGVVRWATMDSSPQGSWDWLLSGTTTVKMIDLTKCFCDAQKLIHTSAALANAQGGDDERAECRRLASVLQQHLVIVQGVPVGIGAGRASVPYKAHALSHTTRLTCNSWVSSAKLQRQTFTWTGVSSQQLHLLPLVLVPRPFSLHE